MEKLKDIARWNQVPERNTLLNASDKRRLIKRFIDRNMAKDSFMQLVIFPEDLQELDAAIALGKAELAKPNNKGLVNGVPTIERIEDTFIKQDFTVFYSIGYELIGGKESGPNNPILGNKINRVFHGRMIPTLVLKVSYMGETDKRKYIHNGQKDKKGDFGYFEGNFCDTLITIKGKSGTTQTIGVGLYNDMVKRGKAPIVVAIRTKETGNAESNSRNDSEYFMPKITAKLNSHKYYNGKLQGNRGKPLRSYGIAPAYLAGAFDANIGMNK